MAKRNWGSACAVLFIVLVVIFVVGLVIFSGGNPLDYFIAHTTHPTQAPTITPPPTLTQTATQPPTSTYTATQPPTLTLTTTETTTVSVTDTATLTPVFTETFTPTVLPALTWWEVYFTEPLMVNDPADYAGSIEDTLIAYINSAQTSIHIASFEFDLTPVAEALIAAHGRGVDVRWVTDNESGLAADAKAGHGQFAMLQQAGVEVRSDKRKALMHDKFWIFDGQTVWTGSTNITINGIFEQNNNVIILHSPAVAAMYENEFAEMWAGQFGSKSPSTASQQTTFVDNTPVGVLFAPEDKVISQIVPLLQNAQTSIRFLAFSFTHDSLGAAMLERAGAGVDVRGVFENTASETVYSELPRLYCAGVPVRQDGNPGFMHDKIIIIDGQVVITGSLNFSDSADTKNDENVVTIGNADIAALYLQEFERLWGQASDPQGITCP